MTSNYSSTLDALQAILIALSKHGLTKDQKAEIDIEAQKLRLSGNVDAAEILENMP